jgi:selenocysteine-specific elongation factor
VDVKLRLLAEVKNPLRHGSIVNFFVGSDEVLAKVHLLDREELKAGDVCWAQLTLTKPTVLVKGDHFVIRSSVATLGGGQIVDSHASRHRRFRDGIIENLKTRSEGKIEDVLVATIETSQPISLESLLVKCNLTSDEVSQAIENLLSAGQIVLLGQCSKDALLFTAGGWENFAKKAKAIAEQYHRRFPTRPGIPKSELSSKLRLGAHSPALDKLFQDGILKDGGTFASLPSHKVQLSEEQQRQIAAFLKALNENPYSPPGDMTISDDLLAILLEQRRVIKVAEGIVFSAAAYDDMLKKVIGYIKQKGKVTVGEVRDLLGTSRKYAIALLEHMDEKKITRRIGDERVLR